MIYEYSISTTKTGFQNITGQVLDTIRNSGVKAGIAVVYCPHTTAGITINEAADPDVLHDLLVGLDKAFPDRQEFKHSEGNSEAHLKASAIGSSVTVIIENGKIILGTWQLTAFPCMRCLIPPGCKCCNTIRHISSKRFSRL